jgi:hypothetical protein
MRRYDGMPIMLNYEERLSYPECPSIIPMRMMTDKQAMRNHGGQNLDRLAARGGLGPCEAIALIESRPWSRMRMNESVKQLMILHKNHMAEHNE